LRNFTRSSPGSLAGSRGIGIGLTLCKRLVEAQAGRIWINGGPAGNNGVLLAAREGLAEGSGEDMTDPVKAKILFVEDDARTQKLVCQILEKEGYKTRRRLSLAGPRRAGAFRAEFAYPGPETPRRRADWIFAAR